MKNDKIISAKVFFGGWVMRLSLFERLHGMSSLTPDSSFLRVIFVRETKQRGVIKNWGKERREIPSRFYCWLWRSKRKQWMFDYDSKLLSCWLSLAVSYLLCLRTGVINTGKKEASSRKLVSPSLWIRTREAGLLWFYLLLYLGKWNIYVVTIIRIYSHSTQSDLPKTSWCYSRHILLKMNSVGSSNSIAA